MAITAGATVGQQGMGSTVRMTSQARIKITLDDSYPTSGYTDFSTTVKAITGLSKITILDIQQAGPANDGATFYDLVYDRANDTLMVLTGGAQAGNETDLSALADVELIVTFV